MAPQYADFAKEEFEARYAKTRTLMATKNIDAMLITERLNYQYYSGHRSEQCAVDKIRSYMVILPKDGEPTLITMPFEVAQVEQTSFITDIRTTGGLMGHPEFIIGVLKELGPVQGAYRLRAGTRAISRHQLSGSARGDERSA